MVHIFDVSEPIFGSKVTVFIGNGNRQELVDAFLKKFKMSIENCGNIIALTKDEEVNGLHSTIFDNGCDVGHAITIVDKNKSTTLDTIIHECIHFTTSVFDYVGMQHEKSNDELYAYLHGYYVRQIAEKISESNKKDKKNGNVRKTGSKQVSKRKNNNKG
jgi:hypothetical protein